MNRFVIFCFSLFVSCAVWAQNVAINEDGSLPDPSAILDLQSDSRGLLIPRMSAAEMEAIEHPATGLLVYGMGEESGLFYYDGADWVPVSMPSDELRSVTDADGNSYDVVRIGSHDWMGQNLRVSRFRNGDPIPVVYEDAAWFSADGPARTAYNSMEEVYAGEYGLLYNVAAVSDARGLCPPGWEVATGADWDALAGLALKALSGWEAPNTGAGNSSGFSALPAGYRDASGSYHALGFEARFHVAGAESQGAQGVRLLRYDAASLDETTADPAAGLSVRCIRKDDG